MSLSLVQYSDVKFQTPTLRVFTQFSIHSHKTICLLYHVRHQNKNLLFFLMKVLLNRGPGFDPIMGSRAVPEIH